MNKDEVKLAFYGQDGVGKSALTIRLINNHFVDEYDPTIEDFYRKQIQVDKLFYIVEVLDTSDEASCQQNPAREEYLRYPAGVILMFAIDDRKSFDALGRYYNNIIELQRDQGAQLFVCGCKSDVEAFRQIPRDEIQEFADTIHAPVFEVSAKNTSDVHEMIDDCVRLLAERRSETSVIREPKKCFIM